MVRILMRWFPERTFVLAADGNYATHELAELAARTPRRLTFVSLFYANANLVETARRSTRARDAPGSRGRICPAPRKSSRPPSSGRGWRSPGTAGAGARSRS